MDGLEFLLLALVIVVPLIIGKLQHDRRRKRSPAWQAAAKELGLRLRLQAMHGPLHMSGRVEDLSVEVEEPPNEKTARVRFSVQLPAPVPLRMRLSAENVLTRMGNEDVQTGDQPFDEVARIWGEEVEILSRLGEPARRALRPLLERHATLERGKLALEMDEHVTDASTLIRTVRDLVHAARLLHLDGMDEPEALARNAAQDSNPRVRLRNLSVLWRDHPHTEAARQAAARALDDPDSAVRLRAAHFLPGKAAGATLRSLVLVRSPAQPWVQVEALRELARKCAYPEISDAVAVALEAAEEELRQEAVKVIGRAKDREKVDALAAMVEGAPPPLAEALAETLGQLGGPRAEEALLRLLAYESNPVRRLAAQALGEIGTVRAVEPLLPLTRGLLGGELQQAARDAVRRIQARLGDVEAGRLSVVDDQGGALSLPQPVGAVAVVEDD